MSAFRSIALAGVWDFEAEGQEVGGVFEDVAEAVDGPGRDDGLPLGRSVPSRADGFGENGLAGAFHHIAHWVQTIREAEKEVLGQLG